MSHKKIIIHCFPTSNNRSFESSSQCVFAVGFWLYLYLILQPVKMFSYIPALKNQMDTSKRFFVTDFLF